MKRLAGLLIVERVTDCAPLLLVAVAPPEFKLGTMPMRSRRAMKEDCLVLIAVNL